MGRTEARALSGLLPSRTLSWRSLHEVWPALLVAAGYYFGCLAGFGLRFPGSGISFFWPPTAVLTAALLLTAVRTWPALLAASLIAHAVAPARDGVPLSAWPVQFLGNAAQAVIAAAIVRRASRDSQIFSDARRVLIFIGGAGLVAPAVASLIPASVYVSLGWATHFWQAWRERAISNAVASLTLLPSLITLWQYVSASPRQRPRRLVEYALLLGGIIGAHAVAASLERTDTLGLSAVLYAPAPFLLWATVRFGGGGLSFALVATTLMTVSSAWSGHGPLGGGAAADRVVGTQLLIVANAIPMLVIAGLIEQTRREHRALMDAEREN